MKIRSTKPQEEIQEKNDQSLPQQTIEGDNGGEIHHIAIKQALDIDRDDSNYDNDVNILVRWAKSQSESDDPMDLMWAIRDLRMRLGTPTHGDSIKHLTRFAYLDLEEKRIKSEKASFV